MPIIRAVGPQQYRGIEVALGAILPGLNVSHYLLDVANAHVKIAVPAPGAVATLLLAGLTVSRRRRGGHAAGTLASCP